MKKPKKYPSAEAHDFPPLVAEYEALYGVPKKSVKKEVAVKDFTYSHFKKIADKGPFTLNEWAALLYISERSLHRYAKDGSGFNGLQIERILLLESFIELANAFFGKEGFKQWLQSRPFSLNGQVYEKLATHDGIQEVIDLLHRMEQGIPA